MLDARMQAAYLSSFQYDDIDNTALSGEVDCTPRVGDEGVITWAVPRYTQDGLWQDVEYEEQLFRIGVMETSGLPVIECRDDTGDEWDEYPPLVFDLLDSAGDATLTLTLTRRACPEPDGGAYPYGMRETDPKLFDLDERTAT